VNGYPLGTSSRAQPAGPSAGFDFPPAPPPACRNFVWPSQGTKGNLAGFYQEAWS